MSRGLGKKAHWRERSTRGWGKGRIKDKRMGSTGGKKHM